MQHGYHSEGGANLPKQARVADFWPDPDRDDHSKLQGEDQTDITRLAKTQAGRQRHKCKTCNCTFVETKGTIFYRRRTPAMAAGPIDHIWTVKELLTTVVPPDNTQRGDEPISTGGKNDQVGMRCVWVHL